MISSLSIVPSNVLSNIPKSVLNICRFPAHLITLSSIVCLNNLISRASILTIPNTLSPNLRISLTCISLILTELPSSNSISVSPNIPLSIYLCISDLTNSSIVRSGKISQHFNLIYIRYISSS